MQDTVSANEELSPADLSPELTKHFRGLRVWLPLKLIGLAPFRACLAEKSSWHAIFTRKSSASTVLKLTVPGFVGSDLPLRAKARRRQRLQSKTRTKMHEDGRVFISSTVLDGTFTLRAAVLAFRTHRDTIDLALDMLRQKAEQLAAE